MNQIPNLLKQTRKARGITQGQLAEVFDVTRVTIANWEAGKHQPTSATMWQAQSAYPSDHWAYTLATMVLDELQTVASAV
jgi:transcriptional regulator with XRE-family HTH domain